MMGDMRNSKRSIHCHRGELLGIWAPGKPSGEDLVKLQSPETRAHLMRAVARQHEIVHEPAIQQQS